MADDYTTKKKKMVADAERENAGKSFLDNERSMGRIPVGVSPEVEGGPKAGMTMMSMPNEPRPPRAVVRGNADEMTAEYYAPQKAKSRVDESSSVSREAARAAADRLKKAEVAHDDQRQAMLADMALGGGLGAAIGGGLAGPGAPVGAAIGGSFGSGLAGLVSGVANNEIRKRTILTMAENAISYAIQNGAFTEEEFNAAADELGVKYKRKK